MKFLVVLAAVLGVFLAESLANDNIQINNVRDDQSKVSQTVNINNQNNVATINNWEGWRSWDSVCDYGAGFAATRLYNKRICVITKINKETFPSLEQLSAYSKDSKLPANRELRVYTVNQRKVNNIGEFGRHVESLCNGLSTYTAMEMPGE
ncbi:hypothetical protein GDO86_006587 [Hymenochirus boettgeri]|uniref:BRICHOS domain-containing protein n=1 Tax=Hymenochirus boettgeri TaxID=247094 RepID=A0A8T2JBN3_9PIPI|nr:hypothetical protein GDO86_006587 [Hymenochirus boettgeri]